jgi:hypothetical protein
MSRYSNFTLLAVSGAITLLLSLLTLPALYAPYVEGIDYVAIAENRIHDAYFYYAGRVAHPWTVHLVASVLNIPTLEAFRVIAVVAAIWFVVCLQNIVAAESGLQHIVLPMCLTPSLLGVFQNYYFPDLFHAAVIGLALVALRANLYLVFPILFLAHLTRESTVFLTVVLVFLGLRARKRGFVAALLVLAAVAMGSTAWLTSQGLPNKHELGSFAFYPLKALYNICFNVLGLVFWTNTNAETLGCATLWRVAVPWWLHLGAVREVGFCGLDVEKPLRALRFMMTTFGVLPGVLGYLLLKSPRNAWLRLKQETLLVQTALLYGLCCFVLAPLIGTWVERYVFYAWPCFWIATPILLSRHDCWRCRGRVALGSTVIMSVWLPFTFAHLVDNSVWWELVVVILESALSIIAVIIISFSTTMRQSATCTGVIRMKVVGD